MPERLLVEWGADGRARVMDWPAGEQYPRAVEEPRELAWPLADEELGELRWYLEDYLRVPTAVYGERGARVAGRLPEWGERVFGAVFGDGPARDAYVAARARAAARGGSVEIALLSASARELGRPWELMTAPGRAAPLALDGVAVSRGLLGEGMRDVFEVPGEGLRVLMVISRPRGTSDVGYRMIARPLLRRLEAVRGTVELVVLRPPTLERLREVLAEARDAGKPFAVVHFDGHGVFGQANASPGGGGWDTGTYTDPGPQGMLAFERPGGGSHLVSAATVAQVLAAARVPVVVLNACQSAQLETSGPEAQVEAAVATRLVREGCASVVAMAYSVYTVAAAEFMTAFYERLFAGDRVADAVTAGRAQLALNDRRPSMKGPLPLHDWMVPVLYARSDVRFPGLRTVRAPEVAVSAALARLREGADDGDHELAPEGEFVGRDAAFYTLEVAARLRRVVVVHGSGGTGKSELAKAFGRWWRDTGGVDRPAWSIWHSFEPGVASFGLDGVVNSVGRRLFAGQEEEFARLDPAARQAAVEKVLANQRVLLLWDNFESVREMPDPGRATPPLSPAEQDRIRAFLDRIARGGRSAVIITSRTPESWLGPAPQRVELGGLDDEEAARYADHLLAGVPNADARRADRNFADLMRWLDGHPLSMRLTLPHLESVGARQLLDGLAGLTALPGEEEADTGDRRGSLNACVAYSFAHLDAKDQRALTVLSLVQGVASVATLEVFSGLAETPGRFRGLSDDDWFGLFGRAADLGLLTPLGADMFGLHPALPAHLAARWRAQAPATHGRERAAALETLAFAYGAFGHWLLGEIIGGNAQLAFTLVRTQQRMFGAVLGHALDREEWGIALDLLLPLDAYGQAQGLAQELLAWTDRVRLAVEAPDGTPPAPDSPAGALWVYVVNAQAGRDVLAGRPDQAEAECRAVLHAFGWKPGAKNHPDLVLTFHLLGVVAQLRGHLDDAETWLRKALTIRKGLEHQPDIANSYHQLGIVAQLRGDLKDSETWHRKALTVRTRLGNRPDLATTFHQLGVVAYLRGDLDDAETWYGRALALKEELGDLAGLANTCHQLGALAQERGHLDNAEGWHHRALVLREDLGDQPGLAATHHQLGLLAEMRQDPAQALAWLVSCVSLFDEFPSPFTDPAPRNLRRLTARLGLPALERAWLDATGDQLPPAVRAYVLADAPDAEPGDPGGPEPEPGAAPGGRSRGRRPLTSFLRRALRHDPDRR